MGKKGRKEGVFLSGEYVYLTALNVDDVYHSNWYDWFNDEVTTQFIQQHYVPNTKEKQIEFVKNLNSDASKIQLGIKAIEGDDHIIGVISLQNLDYINRKAEISLVLGEAKYRKVTYSLDAFRLMINHAFNTLNLNKVWAGTLIKEWVDLVVRTFNFKEEGVLKQDAYKDGRYVDVYRYAVLREDWKG